MENRAHRKQNLYETNLKEKLTKSEKFDATKLEEEAENKNQRRNSLPVRSALLLFTPL